MDLFDVCRGRTALYRFVSTDTKHYSFHHWYCRKSVQHNLKKKIKKISTQSWNDRAGLSNLNVGHNLYSEQRKIVKRKSIPAQKRWKHSVNLLLTKSLNRPQHEKWLQQMMSANPVLIYYFLSSPSLPSDSFFVLASAENMLLLPGQCVWRCAQQQSRMTILSLINDRVVEASKQLIKILAQQ